MAAPGIGEFFGEGCLAAQPSRPATAAAAADSSVMRLEKSVMIAAFRDEPAFSALFISCLLGRSLRAEEDLADQLLEPSEVRLARLLLRFANFGEGGKADAMIPKISQEALAETIGATRSRVSFFMNKFRKLGFIEYGNGSGLTVHSSLLNLVLRD